jgi:hypothetical protein
VGVGVVLILGTCVFITSDILESIASHTNRDLSIFMYHSNNIYIVTNDIFKYRGQQAATRQSCGTKVCLSSR